MFAYLGGFFLGFILGANDTANLFGTAVSSHMVRFRTAVLLVALFVIIGALLQGAEGIQTYRKLSQQTIDTAVVTSFAAALTVTLMTLLKIPVSTSQAVVGAIIGIGLVNDNVRWGVLGKVIICWLATPVGGLIFAVLAYHFFRLFIDCLQPDIFVLDLVTRIGLIVCGCYGAYALGANNVANVAAVFVGESGLMLQPHTAALIGGVSIAVGAATMSRPVMMTVGKGIIKLDAYSAFICVLAHSITVHIFAMIGVPVSSTQAIVGSILGISIIKGLQIINYRTLRNVIAGWTATPFIAAAVAMVLQFTLSAV